MDFSVMLIHGIKCSLKRNIYNKKPTGSMAINVRNIEIVHVIWTKTMKIESIY